MTIPLASKECILLRNHRDFIFILILKHYLTPFLSIGTVGVLGAFPISVKACTGVWGSPSALCPQAL